MLACAAIRVPLRFELVKEGQGKEAEDIIMV
jgi:hypothetical protein